MPDAVIVAARRTAVGTPDGAPSSTPIHSIWQGSRCGKPSLDCGWGPELIDEVRLRRCEVVAKVDRSGTA
jgi:hypothetical protein